MILDFLRLQALRLRAQASCAPRPILANVQVLALPDMTVTIHPELERYDL